MILIRNALVIFMLMLGVSLAPMAVAQQVSILQTALFQSDRTPLIQVRQTTSEVISVRTAASLFAGQDGASLFAPYPLRQRRAVAVAAVALPARNATQIERIRLLIGQAESGRKSYDAVQHGATIAPPKPPTQMSIQEIYDWIAETPGQQHAIGHYQFIPSTLKRLVIKLGVSRYQLFTPRLQDQLGDVLLVEAGLNAFGRGEMERHTFMNNMAKIWAGLPTSSGKSHYEGIAGNHATLTWAHFDREMNSIFPDEPLS